MANGGGGAESDAAADLVSADLLAVTLLEKEVEAEADTAAMAESGRDETGVEAETAVAESSTGGTKIHSASSSCAPAPLLILFDSASSQSIAALSDASFAMDDAFDALFFFFFFFDCPDTVGTEAGASDDAASRGEPEDNDEFVADVETVSAAEAAAMGRL